MLLKGCVVWVAFPALMRQNYGFCAFFGEFFYGGSRVCSYAYVACDFFGCWVNFAVEVHSDKNNFVLNVGNHLKSCILPYTFSHFCLIVNLKKEKVDWIFKV